MMGAVDFQFINSLIADDLEQSLEETPAVRRAA
jgi:hypothetical protein